MRRWGGLVAGLVVVGLAAWVAAGWPSSGEPDADRGEDDGQVTATVERETLAETTEVNGRVGYGADRVLPISASGIVTAAPKVGDVLHPGATAVRVNERPVVLVQSRVPLYRDLRRVTGSERDEAGERLEELSGPDVRALQAYLVLAGYDDGGRLEVDGEFGQATERAVKAWQRAVGHPATGTIGRAQMLFIDGAVRVRTSPVVGAPFDSLTVTSTRPAVTASVSNDDREFFQRGDRVVVEAAANTYPGRVVRVTRQTGDDGQPSHNVDVRLRRRDDLSGVESVSVTASRVVAEDALTIPASGLLALAEGGWAVEVVEGDDNRLVPVELEAVVDGRAAVSGVEADTEVVVL